MARANVAPGHPTQPLGWDDIRQKFMDCAAHGRLDAGRAERAFEILTKLEGCGDVNEIVDLLTLN